jgi:hypothetical protein
MLREKFRSIFSFHLALASILGMWIYMLAGREIQDPDIWWHLRNAQFLFTHLKFPRVDLYSYTTLGQPWINHEWLAEIPYYLAWRAGGLVGIWICGVVLAELILLGVFYWTYKDSGNLKGSFLVSIFCVLLAVVNFGPRTILFGYLYLLILLLVLWRYRNQGRGPLWVIPLLFCFWANTHGSWLIGLLVFGIIVASGLREGNWGRVEAKRWSPQQLRELIATGTASVAAVFINPYGYKLVFYPFDMAFRQKLNIANVEEWASVNFHDGRGKVVLIFLAAMVIVALLGRYRWTLEEVGLTLFALYSGLTYVRFLFLAAVLIAPILAKQLDMIPPYRPEIDKPVLNGVIFALVLTIMVWRVPSSSRLENFIAEKFPAKAMANVKGRTWTGNIFNLYMWGGYINWYDPQLKTYIDSRTDIFEYTGVLQDYLDIAQIKNTYAVLDKYQVRYVFYPTNTPLSYLLKNNPNWKIISQDDVAMVFEREGSIPAQPPAGPTHTASKPP